MIKMLDAKKIKVGICSIGWTNDDLPELGGDIPFEQCIQEMHDAGYVGSEVGNKYPKDPAALKKALAPVKLNIASQWFSSFFTTLPLEETIEPFKKQLAFLKAMGSKVIVISEQGNSIQGQQETPIFSDAKPVLDDEGWDKLVAGLEAAGEIANKQGMKVVVHHHMGTCIQTREEVDILMQKADPSKVFLLCDTGHMTYAGGDAVALLHDYADRIKHIHLKDIRADVLQQVKDEGMSFLNAVKAGVFTVPGDGCVDWDGVFAEIDAMNYEGWWLVEAEQDPEKAPPFEYAKKARDFVREKTGI
jgi:inosose dehydratase